MRFLILNEVLAQDLINLDLDFGIISLRFSMRKNVRKGNDINYTVSWSPIS